jgi:hypothetical protein
MKRVSLAISAIITLLLSGYAQVPQPISRAAFRTAYKSWRETDAGVERDASGGGAAVAARAGQVAELAKNYGMERAAFLRQMEADMEKRLAWLNTPPLAPPPDMTAAAAAQVTTSMTSVQRSAATYANDSDSGIQQVRMALERENQLLSALSGAIAEGKKLSEAATGVSAEAAKSQANALAKYGDVVAGFKQATEETDRETAAWAEYYRLLADGVQSIPTETSAGVASSFSAAPVSPPETAATPPPAPTALLPPPPLVRYIGEWTYLPDGAHHGTPPETLDMSVTQEDGFVKGAVSARFKVPSGNSGDPILRFTFTGDFRQTHNQVFALETSDGVQGRIELIPGPAFNLLEINFLTDPNPGKVRQANVVLVKK